MRQLSDVVEIDNPIATPPPTAAAEATAAGTSGSSLGLPSTPTSTRMSKGRGNTRSRTRNSICTKAAPKMTNNKAKTRASDGASLTPTTAAAPPLGAARNATASSGHGNTTSTTASRGGWSCVSCSFLNVETAKKCSMCGTKNYQPRPRTPMIPLAAGSAEAAGASNGAEGAPEPVARGEARRATTCDTSMAHFMYLFLLCISGARNVLKAYLDVKKCCEESGSFCGLLYDRSATAG